MNRQIKFRIWSKLINKWITDLYLENLCRADITLNQLFSNNDDVVFQQSTNLKDKNGTEIFEGDIIEELCYEDWGDNEGFKLKSLVDFDTIMGCFGTRLRIDGKIRNNFYLTRSTKVEVLGNILENPEFLNKLGR